MEKYAQTIARFATLLIVAVAAIIIGYDARSTTPHFGPVSTIATHIGSIPHTLRVLLTEHPEYLKPVDEFEPSVNTLDADIYALHTFGPMNEARLINLRDDSAVRSWKFGEKKPYPNARYFANLLPDSSLFAYIHEGDWMGRVSADNQILWERQGELVYHHSAELSDDETAWICARDVEYLFDYGDIMLDTVYLNEHSTFPIMDEVALKIDLKTGATLDSISLLDIYLKNGLNPVYKSYYGPAHGDAFHLNDIQPVTFTDTVNNFLPGDLLMSNRTQNELIHMRPSTGEILHFYNQGLYSQHDVDVWGDTLIVCFNNNAPSLFIGSHHETHGKEHLGIHSKISAFLLDGTPVELPINAALQELGVYSETEGLVENLGDGWIVVEEQNNFTIYVFHYGELKFRGPLNYFAKESFAEIPNWTNFYTK